MISPPLGNDLIEKFYNLIIYGKIEELKTFLSSLSDSSKAVLARTPYRDIKKNPDSGNEYRNPIYAAVSHDRLDVLPELLKFKNLRNAAYYLLLEQLEERPINIALVKKLINLLKDDEEIADRLAAPLYYGYPTILQPHILRHLELVQEALKIGPVAKAAGPILVTELIYFPEVTQELLKLESLQQFTAKHPDKVLHDPALLYQPELVKKILAIPGVRDSEKFFTNIKFLSFALSRCNIETFNLLIRIKPVQRSLIKNKGLIFNILGIENKLPILIEKLKSLNKLGHSEILPLLTFQTFHAFPLAKLEEPRNAWWLKMQWDKYNCESKELEAQEYPAQIAEAARIFKEYCFLYVSQSDTVFLDALINIVLEKFQSLPVREQESVFQALAMLNINNAAAVIFGSETISDEFFEIRQNFIEYLGSLEEITESISRRVPALNSCVASLSYYLADIGGPWIKEKLREIYLQNINPYQNALTSISTTTEIEPENVLVIQTKSVLQTKATLWNALYQELMGQITEENVKSLQDVVESITIGNTKEEALEDHFKSTKKIRPKK